MVAVRATRKCASASASRTSCVSARSFLFGMPAQRIATSPSSSVRSRHEQARNEGAAEVQLAHAARVGLERRLERASPARRLAAFRHGLPICAGSRRRPAAAARAGGVRFGSTTAGAAAALRLARRRARLRPRLDAGAVRGERARIASVRPGKCSANARRAPSATARRSRTPRPVPIALKIVARDVGGLTQDRARRRAPARRAS